MTTFNTKHPIPADGRKLNVCAYARVSSDKDLAEMSLETQIQFYTTEILKRDDWEYCGVYADEGITGTSIANRENFIKMVNKALHGFIDIILVKSISRFGRNITDVISAINELRKNGVEVYFEKENISTLDNSSTIALNLYAKLAEQEAKNVSENVLWSVEKRMKKGRYRIPVEEMLGYAYDGDKLVIIEQEAKVVREIFDMYVEGLSISYIAKEMEKRGYKTGMGKTQWGNKSVTTILCNEKYVGDCLLHKTMQKHMSSRTQIVNRGEKDAYYVKNGHPAIISREVWDKAEAIREERRIKMGKSKGMVQPPKSVYAGFGLCPYCGKNYYIKRLSNAKEGIKKCLACGSNRAMLTCRESESVFLDDLKAILIKQIGILKSNPIEFKNALRNTYVGNKEALQEKVCILNGKIDNLRAKYKAIENKIGDSFNALKNEIENELNDLFVAKQKTENELLTSNDAEIVIKQIFDSLDKINEDNIEESFRILFKRMIVKNRLDLTFIIGNENVTNLNLLDLKKILVGSHQIKVRAQHYTVKFGIFINK